MGVGQVVVDVWIGPIRQALPQSQALPMNSPSQRVASVGEHRRAELRKVALLVVSSRASLSVADGRLGLSPFEKAVGVVMGSPECGRAIQEGRAALRSSVAGRK